MVVTNYRAERRKKSVKPTPKIRDTGFIVVSSTRVFMELAFKKLKIMQNKLLSTKVS